MGDAMPERWLSVVGREGSYEVSDLGRVYSIPRPRTRGGILKPGVNSHGYLVLAFYKPGGGRVSVAVHQLVMEAFVGPGPKGMEIRHLDGNPANGALSNLAYGTHGETMRDKRGHGTDHEANKTHCDNGHEFTPENTFSVPSKPNRRDCRKCHRASGRRRAARLKAQRAAQVNQPAEPGVSPV